MIIAITGASGFVGGHLVRSLAYDGHSIIALGRRAVPATKNVQFIEWDMTKPTLPTAIHADVFIHSAALTELDADLSVAHAVNVDGTKNAYKLAKNMGVSKFIHISSASVYSNKLNKYRIDESYTKVNTKPANSYALSKQNAEVFLQSQKAAPVIILRPHVVYGPGDTNILPGLLARIKAGMVLLPAARPHEYSVTHIANLIDAVRFFIARPTEPLLHAYNVADAGYVTSTGFLASLLAAADPSLHIKLVPVPLGYAAAYASKIVCALTRKKPTLQADVVRQLNKDSSLSIAKLTALGFTPKHSQRSGMNDTRAWLQSYAGIQDYLQVSKTEVWSHFKSYIVY